MNDRTVIVHEEPVYRETRVIDDSGASGNALIFGVIAVLAIVIIGLFVWQPWTAATTTTTTTSNGQTSTTATNP